MPQTKAWTIANWVMALIFLFSLVVQFNDPGPLRWMLPRFINHATDEKFAHTGELKQLLPNWQQINMPVTVVQGDSDRIVDPSNLQFARRQLAGKQAEFIVLPGAGHLIRWRDAVVVRQILLKQASGKPDARAAR